MKRFIKKSTRFAGLILLYKLLIVGAALLLLTNAGKNRYYGRNTGKPRILLVGASNLDHNYDYATLNRAFGSFDVIGVCLNEPSGFYAIFDKLMQLKPMKQDIVVFCLPHSLYESEKLLCVRSFRKMGYSPGLVLRALRAFPFRSVLNLNAISLRDEINLFRHRRQYTSESSVHAGYRISTEAESDTFYNACTENPEGEFDILSRGFEQGYLKQLRAFIQRSLPCSVFFRFPAVYANHFDIDPDRLAYLSRHYPFINTFDASVYGEGYWYNQWYHLNRCGRDICTRRFLRELGERLTSTSEGRP